MMSGLARGCGFLALIACGIMAGFFFAYSASAMWGLDLADPRHAIDSMQKINVAVENPVFFVFFFGTPLITLLAAALHWGAGARAAGGLFGLAALAYLVGAFGVTVAVNVPMNDALDTHAVPDSIEAARQIWQDYSGRWTAFNHVRTLASTLALGLCGGGMFLSGRP